MADEKNISVPSEEIMRGDLLDEIYRALGIPADKTIRDVIATVVMPVVNRITRWGLRLETLIREEGLSTAAREIMPTLVGRMHVTGEGKVPADGPVVIAANHPAGIESFPITAYTKRDDLKIISSKIGFFEQLPHLEEHLIFTTNDTGTRTRVMRESIRHLRGGGALLIYPSGRIDPDPHYFATASDHLNRWSRSLSLFVKQAPETRVIPVISSSLIGRGYLFSQLTRRKTYRKDRQMMSIFLQGLTLFLLKMPHYNINLTFGDPLSFASDRITDMGAIQERIIANARALLEEHLRRFPPLTQETWSEHPA